tara:strand:- start:7 stop:396 length:390 start_codon:yes stop_codon:yes gene_type:complete
MKEVDDLLKNSKKIQAIKLVRSETRAGLRQAKVACDHRHAELTGKKFPNNTPEAILTSPWCVQKIVMISPDGDKIELNLRELELKFLQEGTRVSVDEVADLLDLTEYIKNWQSRGYSGYVTEKSDVADN